MRTRDSLPSHQAAVNRVARFMERTGAVGTLRTEEHDGEVHVIVELRWIERGRAYRALDDQEDST